MKGFFGKEFINIEKGGVKLVRIDPLAVKFIPGMYIQIKLNMLNGEFYKLKIKLSLFSII